MDTQMQTAPASVLDRVVAWGLMAIVLAAPTQFAFKVGAGVNLSLVDPLVWIVDALWAAAALRARRCVVLVPPASACLFVALAAISGGFAGNRMAAAKDVFQLVEYFLVGFLLLDAGLRQPQLRGRLVAVFLGAATAVVALAVVQYCLPGVEAFAVRGTFGNRNVLGGFLALALPLMLGLALYDGDWKRRVWFLATIAAGLLITLSGGAFVALVLGLSLVSLARGGRALAVCALVLGLLTLAVLPHLPRHNGEALGRSIALYDDDGEPTMRYPEWQAAAEMALDNPWLGVGTGNYQENVGGYYGVLPSAPVKAEADSQNLYLVLASSLGFPGVVAFVGMLLWCARCAVVGAVRATGIERGLAAGAAGSIAAFAVCAIWAPLLVRGIGVPLVFILALACSGAASRLWPRTTSPAINHRASAPK